MFIMFVVSYRIFRKVSFLVIFLLLVFPATQALFYMDLPSNGLKRPAKLSDNLSQPLVYYDNGRSSIKDMIEKQNKPKEPMTRWSLGFVKDVFFSRCHN